jgi:hypothetical protein
VNSPLRIGSLLAVLVSPVVGSQAASTDHSPADTLYAQPGQLVSVNGFRLSLRIFGLGALLVNGAASNREVDPSMWL